MDFDSQVRAAIYGWFVGSTKAPSVADLAGRLGEDPDAIRDAYGRLFRKRVLFLEPDGETIRMAPPFSGVATQHRVRVGDREYFANCSWDSLGIPAALHAPGEVFSRCEQTLEPIRLRVGREGPEPEAIVAHFAVPAAKWWADLVYT
jgi:alkylmercury lyase-like protein